MRLLLRPGGYTERHADALEQTGTRGLDVTISWADVEPEPPAAPGKPVYDWTETDEKLGTFAGRVPLNRVRVVGSPDWAIAPRHRDDEGRCRVSDCPPAPANREAFGRFVTAAAERYGPATKYAIGRWALWNEVNLRINWGGDGRGRSARGYARLLGVFHDALRDPALAAANRPGIDAAEVAAGSPCCDNAPGRWTRLFERHADPGDYDRLAIHPYSESPNQVVAKLRSYRRLTGHPVVPTEVGWAIGEPNPSRLSLAYRCVATEADQARKLARSIRLVRAARFPVPQFVWFTGADTARGGQSEDAGDDVPCLNPYYDEDVRAFRNSFGLFMRKPGGGDGALYPRESCGVYAALAGVASVEPCAAVGS